MSCQGKKSVKTSIDDGKGKSAINHEKSKQNSAPDNKLQLFNQTIQVSVELTATNSSLVPRIKKKKKIGGKILKMEHARMCSRGDAGRGRHACGPTSNL